MGGKGSPLLQNMQNGYGLHPAPYSMFTKVLFGGKWVKAEVDHSSPPSTKFNMWNNTSDPPTY
jgi:hypothetical protein